MTSSQHSSETDPRDVIEIEANCKMHGPYTAKQFIPLAGMRPITSHCPDCMREKQAWQDAEDKRRAEQAKAERIAKTFRRAMIPKRFAPHSLATYRATSPGQKHALDVSSRFAERFENGSGASLIFAGKPGTGKTHLACGIARAVIESGHTAMFGTVLQLVRHVKSTYRHDSERSESEAIDDLLSPDLLIIDEVGAQIGSDHELMILFEIINQRYQECRSTILISNLTSDELSQFLGDRAVDRFRECGAVIAFDWGSHRGVAA